MTFLIQGCTCPFGPLPTQYKLSLFSGNGTCLASSGLTSGFSAIPPNFPTIPWPYMVSASIGCWSNPSVWPGTECVWANEGLFRYSDSSLQQNYFKVF